MCLAKLLKNYSFSIFKYNAYYEHYTKFADIQHFLMN